MFLFILWGDAISIHAPRAGSDRRTLWIRPQHTDFNPRSPCGERQQKRTKIYKFSVQNNFFQGRPKKQKRLQSLFGVFILNFIYFSIALHLTAILYAVRNAPHLDDSLYFAPKGYGEHFNRFKENERR